MKFVLQFDMDNDAFQPHAAEECVRIMRAVAAGINDLSLLDKQPTRIRDVNGNAIGEWQVVRS